MGAVSESNFAIRRFLSYSVQRRAKSWPRCDRNNACSAKVVSVRLGEKIVSPKQFSRCFGLTKTVTSLLALKMADSELLRFSCLSRCDARSLLSLHLPIPCAYSCFWREFQDADRFLMKAAAPLPTQWWQILFAVTCYAWIYAWMSDHRDHWFKERSISSSTREWNKERMKNYFILKSCGVAWLTAFQHDKCEKIARASASTGW